MAHVPISRRIQMNFHRIILYYLFGPEKVTQ